MAKSKRRKDAGRRVALVTGAGSGIGAATARRLAEDGFSVVAADVNLASVRRIAAGLRSGLAVGIDVRDPESCESAVARTLERFGRLDAVVAAAGVQVKAKARADQMAVEEFKRLIEVNLTGVYLTARAAAKPMIESRRGGGMVFLGSVASQTSPMFGIAPYCASKGGVLMLGRSLAVDWAPFDITVNVVAPGVIETPMTAASRADPEKRAAFLSRIHLKRFGKPDEIASVISFLLSADARYMTGAYVPVDGGWLA